MLKKLILKLKGLLTWLKGLFTSISNVEFFDLDTPTVVSDIEVPTAVLPSIKQTSRSQMRQLYSNWMRADTDKDTHLTAMYVFKKLKKKSFIALGLSDFQVKKIQEGRDTQIFLAIRPRHWG